MVEIIPAIIPQSFEDLKDKMSQVSGIVTIVQMDVCDGVFVPSKCWPYSGDAGDFKKILNEDEGFPFWESLDFEADLMIAHPETDAENFIKAGAKRIIIHIESGENVSSCVKELRKKYGYVGDSAVSVEIGIGINVHTPNLLLDEYLTPNEEGRTLADFVQFMGIEKIGYQGQSFDPEVIGKVSDLREKFPDAIISVDGGVNFDNAHDLVAAGVNRLISGSALYESENIKGAIEEMSNA
jgi:ribulose-phosphate 3-epimerase